MINKKKELIKKLRGDKDIFKVSCEYWIKAEDLDSVEEFVIGELSDGSFYDKHISIYPDSFNCGDIFEEV